MTLKQFIVALIMCVISGAATVSAQRTTRRSLRIAQPVSTDTIALQALDTVVAPVALVAVAGYEKPLRSRRETIHVTNLDTIRPLRLLSLDISYLDIDGNQLHQRKIDLECDIPPHATKMIDFRSWDVQNRFYYSGGPRPRVAAYPFTINLKVISAAYLH